MVMNSDTLDNPCEHTYTVTCESIHPPWYFSYFVALQPGIKIAYHFEDAKYLLLCNKQELRQKTENLSVQNYSPPKVNTLQSHLLQELQMQVSWSISLAHLATGIFAHSSSQNCSSSFKLDGFHWYTAIFKQSLSHTTDSQLD